MNLEALKEKAHACRQAAQHFVSAFYLLPVNIFNALMQCVITSLGLQERYSLVAACTFAVSSDSLLRTCLFAITHIGIPADRSYQPHVCHGGAEPSKGHAG